MPDPIPVVWYQVPTAIATSPEKKPYYLALLHALDKRTDAFPNVGWQFILCPVTDTINLAGEAFLFAGMEQDLLNAGFRPKDIPSGMDGKERAAFQELILRGGKLSG